MSIRRQLGLSFSRDPRGPGQDWGPAAEQEAHGTAADRVCPPHLVPDYLECTHAPGDLHLSIHSLEATGKGEAMVQMGIVMCLVYMMEMVLWPLIVDVDTHLDL